MEFQSASTPRRAGVRISQDVLKPARNLVVLAGFVLFPEIDFAHEEILQRIRHIIKMKENISGFEPGMMVNITPSSTYSFFYKFGKDAIFKSNKRILEKTCKNRTFVFVQRMLN